MTINQERRINMSKCKPTPKDELKALEAVGVTMTDTTETRKGVTSRFVTIKIPYEALRDNKDVQIAFQDIVFISTEDPDEKE
jgi:hypothetical protein